MLIYSERETEKNVCISCSNFTLYDSETNRFEGNKQLTALPACRQKKLYYFLILDHPPLWVISLLRVVLQLSVEEGGANVLYYVFAFRGVY
jgi:hypothetical protein